MPCMTEGEEGYSRRSSSECTHASLTRLDPRAEGPGLGRSARAAGDVPRVPWPWPWPCPCQAPARIRSGLVCTAACPSLFHGRLSESLSRRHETRLER